MQVTVQNMRCEPGTLYRITTPVATNQSRHPDPAHEKG